MTLKFKAAIASAAAGLISACSPVSLLNAVTPSGSFDKLSDVSFGDLPRLKLDIYRADEERPGSPILLFVHGGGWDEGKKDIYKFLGDSFTSEGYTTVIPNYRLYPEARFPDMIEDTAKAVAFTHKRYPDRPIILIGHSAGAYNALMTGLDPQWLRAENVDRCVAISGIVSIAGPTGAYELTDEPYITIFPDRFKGQDAPLAHATGSAPPLLFIHGGQDETVGVKNSEELSAAIEDAGGETIVKIYPDLDHIDVVRVLSRYFDGGSSLKSDLLDFIKTRSENTGTTCE